MCSRWIVNDNIENLRAEEVRHIAPKARAVQRRAGPGSATGTPFFALSHRSIPATHSVHPTRRRIPTSLIMYGLRDRLYISVTRVRRQ